MKRWPIIRHIRFLYWVPRVFMWKWVYRFRCVDWFDDFDHRLLRSVWDGIL